MPDQPSTEPRFPWRAPASSGQTSEPADRPVSALKVTIFADRILHQIAAVRAQCDLIEADVRQMRAAAERVQAGGQP